jgi:hypothetical protein
MRGRHARAYRALLRLYPRRFRAEYQDEMTRLFAQQVHYARVTEGWAGVLRVWIRSLIDLVATAPTEHLENEVLVASPIGSRDKPAAVRLRPSASPWAAIGLLPLWTLPVLAVLAPDYLHAAILNPPAMLGLPFGVVAIGGGILWAALGVVVMANTTSIGLRILALILFTIPSTVIVLFCPAFVLILINLTPQTH